MLDKGLKMNHEEQEDGFLKVLRVNTSREDPGAPHTSRDALSTPGLCPALVLSAFGNRFSFPGLLNIKLGQAPTAEGKGGCYWTAPAMKRRFLGPESFSSFK